LYEKRGESNTFTQFIADPNKHSIITIALTITGTIVGGGMFLAVGQIGYESVSAGLVLGLVYLIGLTLVGFASTKIRNKMEVEKHDTLIDFLKSHYDERIVMLFSIVNILMYVFLLASQFIAMFQFMQFVDGFIVNKWIPIFLVCLASLSILLIPIIGGLRKDIQTDILQMFIIFIASIIICYKLFTTGDFSYSAEYLKTPENHNNYGIVFIIGSILFLTPSFFVRMDIWQRIKSAKTNKSAKFGFIIAGVLSLFFFWLFTTIGMWANHIGIKESSYATLELIYKVFDNPILLGFLIGGFFAAVLSTADTLINAISIFATRIIYAKKWSTKTETNISKELLSKSRIIGFGVFVIAIILGYLIPNIVDLLVGAISLLLIFLPTILGLFIDSWKNLKASFYSSLVGLISFIILFATWNYKLAFAPAVILTFLTYFIIKITSKRTTKTA
jgi:SSS family solute:Na+ symporter